MSESVRRIQLGLILEALLHRWRVLLLMVIIVPIAGLGARYVFKPKVKSSAQILVQESVKVNPFLKDMMVEWSVKNRLPLISGIIRSRSTLERVLIGLGHIDDDMREGKKELLIHDFQSRIDVYGEGGGLIRISVVGREPQEVYDALKMLTATLIEEMRRPQKEALDKSVHFLTAQLVRIKGELAGLEEKLKKFKKQNAGELPEVHRINLESHLRLTNTIMDTESSLVASQQKQKLAAQRLRRYDPTHKKLTLQLRKAKRGLKSLLGTFTDRHPRVRAARALVLKLQVAVEERRSRRVVLDMDTLVEASNPVVGVQTATTGTTDIIVKADDVLTSDLLQYQAASSETEALRHKLKLLNKRSEGSRATVLSYAANEQYLNRIVRDLEAKTKVYTNLNERYEDALVTRELTRHDEGKQVWIVDAPTGPATARHVSILFLLVAGPLVGLILGLVMVLIFELLDTSVRLESEIEDLIGAPIVGTLPWLDPPKV